MPKSIAALDPKDHILIKDARMHNLKGIDLAIRRNSFTVITGLSGSGKSSLAFDTLFAEGQRRYIESLSAYARQFLGKIEKPDVESIQGISPAIAIEQKVNTRNPRSTVGTSTEIYDYIKLLYARIGRTFSPVSGKEVKRHAVTDVMDFIKRLDEGQKIMVLAPLHNGDRSWKDKLKVLSQQGFSRIMDGQKVLRIDEADDQPDGDRYLVVDRWAVKKDDDDGDSRLADSIQTAFYEGSGHCKIWLSDDKMEGFSNQFEMDGIKFEQPSVHFFSFNNPLGACKQCEGYGSVIGIDPNLVIPDRSLSVYDDAVVSWKGEKMKEWKEQFIMGAAQADFPIHKPIRELSGAQEKILWSGSDHFKGIDHFFKYVEKKSYKIQYRVMLSRYRGKTKCPSCEGSRIRKDANYVKIDGHSISEVIVMSANRALEHFSRIQLNEEDRAISERLMDEIITRLTYLVDVGLGYLTLNRLSNTLSGGESQRINLATSLGSNLTGSMYILDEPSIGLHPRDTERLIHVLKKLNHLGNTLIVVEHDEDIMKTADEIVDLGPGAGSFGGELVFQGNARALEGENTSLTARYLNGELNIELPELRRKWSSFIEVKSAHQNNLKNINVKFPLNVITCVTGVSGSGKSTLVRDVLFHQLNRQLQSVDPGKNQVEGLSGDVRKISKVEFIDQNPIGKSSRSNPVTYLKAYDDIRNLFAGLPAAKSRGYKPSHFSFNVDGGRCPVCKGEGEIKVEMQFMADINLLCEECHGKRFKDDILEIQFHEKNIADVLDMTVDDAIEFFTPHETKNSSVKKLLTKLHQLKAVGLDYVHLGQSSSTLSGGEAQRIKLAFYLTKGKQEGHILFIFDEPTTGLHFHDIQKLNASFNALIKKGHSIIIIEHNLDLIKCADWVIDLGPEGGDEGGDLVFEGTPEALIECEGSYTGKYLKEKIGG